MPKNKENKIIELDKEHLRSLDGVVMDLESYEKHSKKPENPPESNSENANNEKKPTGVFACSPVHVGWYEIQDKITYPIMAGAIMPSYLSENMPCSYLSSGSFLTSYLSSYLTSYITSFSSFFITSGEILPSGYGLELI